jgi:methylase of polypeptide subunit release factors
MARLAHGGSRGAASAGAVMSDLVPEPSQEPPASVYERAVKAAGLTLSKDARILDFCCGAGADAYRFCDRGYANTHAYDVRDYVDRRAATGVSVQ